MGQDLLQYIVTQAHAGYTNEQIRAVLIQSGYPPKEVDAAFRKLAPTKDAGVAHEYAQDYAREGYSDADTFQALIQQGHDPKAARKAVRDVFGASDPVAEHTHTLIYIIIALAIGAGGMYFLLGDGSSSGVNPVDAQPISYSPSERIAQSLAITREQGKDAGITSCTQTLAGTDREKCLAIVAAATDDLALCSQIATADVHDGCLMHFIDEHFDEVCAKVQLVKNKETCESLSSLRSAA